MLRTGKHPRHPTSASHAPCPGLRVAGDLAKATWGGRDALWDPPAHLVRLMRGGPGLPVPPSPGRVSRTLISYSVSGSRCQSL